MRRYPEYRVKEGNTGTALCQEHEIVRMTKRGV